MTDEPMTISLGDVERGMKLAGAVKRIELGGAIIDVGLEECDAMLHISQIRRRRVNNVRDFLSEGQEVTVWVRNVDKVNARLDVTMIEPPAVSWDTLAAGQVHEGKVVRIEKFGVFVDIGAERPGLVHISELAHGYVNAPGDVVSKGQTVEVKVLGVNRDKHQIDLSVKAALPVPREEMPVQPEETASEADTSITAMGEALKRALEGSGSGKKRAEESRKRQRVADEQEDIIQRTLQRHRGG